MKDSVLKENRKNFPLKSGPGAVVHEMMILWLLTGGE
jgi:hypothetical protein